MTNVNKTNSGFSFLSYNSSWKTMTLLFLLGFSSGLPLALTSGTLQAWLTVAKVDLTAIGFLPLVGQAYVFKFLWAPLMDRYQLPFLTRRRSWLVITQIALIIALAAMSFLNPQSHLLAMSCVALVIAFFSASQDIAFDAYRTDILSSCERGLGAAWSTSGYRLAMMVSSGLALWLTGVYISWRSLYLLMSVLMFVGLIATLLSNEPKDAASPPKTLEQAFIIPFSDFFRRNNCWIFLVLIILYKISDAFAMSLSTTFLIRGVGFTLEEIGVTNKIFGLAATIIGAIIGGILMRKLPLFRALLIFGILQGVSNIGYWFLSVTDKNMISMASVIFTENFFSGMGTTAFIALLMVLCNKRFTASQFALLSALSAVGRVYVPPVAAWIVQEYGWPELYMLSVLATIPGILLLLIARKPLAQIQQTGEFQYRNHFALPYKSVGYLLLASGVLLLIALIFIILNYFDVTHLTHLASFIVKIGFALGFISLLTGCVLDYFGMRKVENPV